MEHEFFNIDEAMVEYAEMTSFDFQSTNYLECKNLSAEYAHQPYTFKYGTFDLLDMFKSMFCKANTENAN